MKTQFRICNLVRTWAVTLVMKDVLKRLNK